MSRTNLAASFAPYVSFGDALYSNALMSPAATTAGRPVLCYLV